VQHGCFDEVHMQGSSPGQKPSATPAGAAVGAADGASVTRSALLT
jgi:hypothetical protein